MLQLLWIIHALEQSLLKLYPGLISLPRPDSIRQGMYKQVMETAQSQACTVPDDSHLCIHQGIVAQYGAEA